MRFRTIFLFGFLMAALLPAAVLGWMNYVSGVQREFDDVSKRHLVIAQSLRSSALRIRKDIINGIISVVNAEQAGIDLFRQNELMRRLNIEAVFSVDNQTQKITTLNNQLAGWKPATIPMNLIPSLISKAEFGSTKFTRMYSLSGNRKVVYAVDAFEGRVVIAQISSSFLNSISLGVELDKSGHAVVFNRYGDVLARPDSLDNELTTNISSTFDTKSAFNTENSIQRFYYPNGDEEMIAGIASVPSADWGIMVSQPVSEIQSKVSSIIVKSFAVVLFGLMLAVIGIAGLLKLFVRPIEKAVAEMRNNADGQRLSTINVVEGRGAIGEFKDLQDSYNHMVRRMAKSSEQLKRLAYVDSVTDLPNREKFQDSLDRVLADEKMVAQGGSVIFVDMDNFKEVNDLHGHNVGDQFLNSVAKSLSFVASQYYSNVRRKDDGALKMPVVSRIGGDEFTLLVPGLTDEDALKAFLETLRKSIAEPTSSLNFLNSAGASIGCARYPLDGTVAHDLFKRSDIAMYHAKSLGKNRAVIFKPEIGTQTEAELRRDVLLAIENDELFLEYQPKVYARDRSIAGVEALVRWNHPEKGVLSPNDWLPAISNSHVIVKLGDWVVENAMRDHAKWSELGFDLRLAVNIGAKQFIAPGFVSTLNRLARRYNFNSSLLEIEVTEDVLFGSSRSAADILMRLREQGYSVSIDDFGKGYSNLARLAELQVDYIKLDQTLVARAQKDPRVRSILSASITLAKELGCQTIAEGVETVRQVDFITHMGADMLQGYYFAKSMPAPNVVPWLQMLGQNDVHKQQTQLLQSIA